MHLLISVCTQSHNPSCYPHCSSHILFHCLDWFHSLWMFRSHNLGFPTVSLYYGDRLSVSCPTPNLEGQSTILITPGAGWLSYTPRHQLPILVGFYNLHRPQWNYPLPQSPHEENSNTLHSISYLNITPVNPYTHRRWLQCTEFYPFAQ
jgi:hypothetical protein